MALVDKYRRPGIRVEHTIQTNGTEMTPEWCEFYRHGVLIGERKSGSSGNAMSDAATFRHYYERIRKAATR
jgi:uncharacterized protein